MQITKPQTKYSMQPHGMVFFFLMFFRGHFWMNLRGDLMYSFCMRSIRWSQHCKSITCSKNIVFTLYSLNRWGLFESAKLTSTATSGQTLVEALGLLYGSDLIRAVRLFIGVYSDMEDVEQSLLQIPHNNPQACYAAMIISSHFHRGWPANRRS